jgi:hypothetical protein
MAWDGRSVTGTVTQVAVDHYTIATQTGESYTVSVNSSTRLLKQVADNGGGKSSIAPTDITVGDTISSVGDIDKTAKTVIARVIVKADPERVKQMREMEANYGKTWLAGSITAINNSTITIVGSVDGKGYSFVTNGQTSFRDRNSVLTLADLKVGDVVRAQGTLSNGVFDAATVDFIGIPRRVPVKPIN